MSDWIDKLKQNESTSARLAKAEANIRLHDDEIIKANASTFWDAAVKYIDEYREKLRKEFPNDKRRHCHRDYTDSGTIIINEGKPPRMELAIELNVNGHCLNLFESRKIDMFNPPTPARQWKIGITVDAQEELEFRWNGAAYNTPEGLAEALVRHVCEITR